MTPDIKELVKRLQRIQVGMANEEEDAVLAAIAALEALAGEVDFERAAGHIQFHRAEAAEKESDRLKEALLDIKHFGAGFAQDRARKALGDAS